MPESDELGIEQWKDFIAQISGCFDSKIEIGITGGEPLLKEGVLDLIKICSENGFRTVMTTNAYLINEVMAEKIAESGLTLIFISLDSMDEQTHDFLRGVEGAYTKVMRAIDHLDKVRNGLEIGIQTLISDKNLDGLIELMKWIDSDTRINTNYVQVINIPINAPLDASWYKREEFSSLWPKDIKKNHSALSELIKLKENKSKISNSVSHLNYFKSYFENPLEYKRSQICPFAYTSLNISKRGDVYLCWEMEPLGNIKVDNVKSLWFSEKTEQIRKKMAACRKNCPALINCNLEE